MCNLWQSCDVFLDTDTIGNHNCLDHRSNLQHMNYNEHHQCYSNTSNERKCKKIAISGEKTWMKKLEKFFKIPHNSQFLYYIYCFFHYIRMVRIFQYSVRSQSAMFHLSNLCDGSSHQPDSDTMFLHTYLDTCRFQLRSPNCSLSLI